MLITMNDRELQRLTIIQDVLHQNLSRRDALKLLGLSYRQLQRLDGSHHDWFEGRSDKCCLLVFIDDATGRLMNLRFSESESHL
jgi:hypothetical protein